MKNQIAEFTTNMAKHAPPEVIGTLGTELRKLASLGS